MITVGNTAPTIEILTPENGSFVDWGDTVAFEVKVTDPEDHHDRLLAGAAGPSASGTTTPTPTR